jgi:two-component sensor histidine kinase
MLGHATDYLASGEFMPHGMCVMWRPDLIWLHAVSDGLIALSYYSIPITLLYFLARRRDLVFPGVLVLFAAFILACGTTHLMSIWTLWHPDYWLDGGIKAVTAIVSVLTAVLLWRLMPDALAMPSGAQLETANRALALQIDERSRAEGSVRQLNQELEQRVSERTADLEAANGRLRAALAEKEVLLREIQHRVKNNLQVVFSLLSLQARKAPAGLKAHFQESLERIGAMGRVHEQLYRGEEAGTFAADALIQATCQDLAQAYGGERERIVCRVESRRQVHLPVDVATPLALIVSEVVSNAFKHAFADGRRGEIVVTLAEAAGEIRLEIRDDGVGFATEEGAARPQSIGLRLIELLAGQIGGRTRWSMDRGTSFCLIIPRV